MSKYFTFSGDSTYPIAPPESFTDEMIRPLDLPLHPGGVGGGNRRFEPVMQRKGHQRVVESIFAGQLPDEHVSHAIVKYLRRDAPEMFEGANMTIEKGGQVASLNEFAIQFSGVSQNH